MKIIPPGVPECVAGQNPPRSSVSTTRGAGKPTLPPMEPRDLWTTARATGTHPARWIAGVPPGLYLARKVMTCLSCFPAFKDTVNISPSRVRLPWVLNRLMKSRLLPIGSVYSSRDNRCRWQYDLVLLSINKLDLRQLRLSPYNRNILHVIEPNRHAK